MRSFTARLGRPFWLALGFASLALAVIGALLPVMPTTCFVLLAAWCFARSSPRLHAWLRATRGFGPVICDWEQHRSMPRAAKVWAIAMIVPSFAFSVAVVHEKLWLATLLSLIGLGLIAFILSVRTSPAARVGVGGPSVARGA